MCCLSCVVGSLSFACVCRRCSFSVVGGSFVVVRRCVLFVVCWFGVRCLLFVDACSLFVECCSLCIVSCVLCVVCCVLFVV